MRLAAFCEAEADFRLVAGLVDRVFRESGPTWVADNFESPEVIRTWQPDVFGRAHFDIHALNRYVDHLGIRGVRGHFNGRPGRFGGAMARKVFLVVRALNRTTPDESVEAVVLVWDTDQQREERPQAVLAAREEAGRWDEFKFVCGFPDPESEAWVLAGFEPCDEGEQACLDRLQRDLVFSPVLHAVRLRGAKGELRDIKRVLRELTGGDPDRAERCWTEPSLEKLRARGGDTGLAAFLDEVEAILVPLLGR